MAGSEKLAGKKGKFLFVENGKVNDPLIRLLFYKPSTFMYPVLLLLHSYNRWLVLISLLLALLRSYRGWLRRKPFTAFDNKVRHITATIVHIQLILGLWLYAISPLASYFLNHFKEAVKQREIRFFGMEHSLMMLSAVVLITIGSAKAKRQVSDRQKFRTMAVWFTLGLVVILSSIPWQFSPLISRPSFRTF